MGVLGLTSYVERNSRYFFNDLKLRNTSLVIDGCSLYFRLYFTSGLDQQHGGDYSPFADLVRSFFEALSVCCIQPFVIMDGGVDHTDKKFATIKQRAQSKIREANTLSRGSRGSVLPICTREVFRQVLSSLQVPFVQCVSEADWEIAALANQLNCAVLTNDSDFYIFDLKGGYVPMAYFQWSNVCHCSKTMERYIPARRYSVNKFCAHFNHINKELLPLFAVMAGNDHVNLRAMENFFSRLGFSDAAGSRGGRAPCRLEGLLLWLACFSGPRQAMEEVLGYLGARHRGTTRAALSSGMREYQLAESRMAPLFAEGAAVPADDLPEPLRALPFWARQALSQGRLAPLIIDALVLERVLLFTQVENCRLPSSHAASLPIRQGLYGLLLSWKRRLTQGRCAQEPGAGGTAVPSVEEYDRQDLNLRRSSVQAALPCPHQQLSLEKLNEVPLPVRLQVLLETLGVEVSLLTAVPPHLSLPLCVTCFWLTQSKPKPSLLYLKALLLGIVFGELCRLMRSQRGAAGPGARAVCDRLGKLQAPLSERRGLDLDAAHLYSQWQSCLCMTFYLNQLLCCPLLEPECAWLYNGTFTHRAVTELRGGVEPETLLAGAPLPGQLYGSLLGAALSSVGAGDFFSAKKNRRGGRGRMEQQRRRTGRRAAATHPSPEELNNRFAMLVCDDEDYGF